MPIREEAINVFMGLPEDGDEPRLELTFNFGRSEPYELGTGYGHIAITTAELDAALERLADRASSPNGPPTPCARAAHACASSAIRTATGSRSSSAS